MRAVPGNAVDPRQDGIGLSACAGNGQCDCEKGQSGTNHHFGSGNGAWAIAHARIIGGTGIASRFTGSVRMKNSRVVGRGFPTESSVKSPRQTVPGPGFTVSHCVPDIAN